MTTVAVVCLGILSLAALLALVRVVWPRTSLPDRIVALDLLLLIIVMGIAVAAVGTDNELFLDVLVVVSLLGFVGTIVVARFIERRGV